MKAFPWLGAALVTACLASANGGAQTAAPRPTLALMNFTNAALINRADYEPLEWSVPELISTRLARNPEIDLVSITAPNALHKEMSLAAIAAGKHVYCEKPLAPLAADALEMTPAQRADIGRQFLG